MKRSYVIGGIALGLVGLGAGLMFFLDPRSGARRRAEVRDRTRRAYRVTADSLERTGVNIANHTRGLAAAAMSQIQPTEAPSDDVLLARVKSRIGHVMKEPRAIELKADHGTIQVSGTLPYRDAQKLMKSLASVRGVSKLENHLAVETTH